jgi:hypothetical protein
VWRHDHAGARVISIGSDDEVQVSFQRGFDTKIMVGDNRAPTQVISLPIEVPIDAVDLQCENEFDDCQIEVAILGT